MDEHFKLSQVEHDDIYISKIRPYSFHEKTPVDRPVFVIIGAQPGAGKSKFVDQVIYDFSGNIVKVNVDDLRRFHPRTPEIRKLDDKLYAERTQADASAWANTVIDQALQTKHSIILETAMRNPEAVASILRKAKMHGYEVDARILAVHEMVSMASAFKRYEENKSGKRGYGRWVRPDLHDEYCRGVLATASVVEQHKLADNITVFDRHGGIIYQNRLERENWIGPLGAAKAIEEERSRPLRERELTDYHQNWELVFQHLNSRNAPPTEIALAKEVQERLESQHKRQLSKEPLEILVKDRDGTTHTYTQKSRTEDLIMLRKRAQSGAAKLNHAEKKMLDTWIDARTEKQVKADKDKEKQKKPRKDI